MLTLQPSLHEALLDLKLLQQCLHVIVYESATAQQDGDGASKSATFRHEVDVELPAEPQPGMYLYSGHVLVHVLQLRAGSDGPVPRPDALDVLADHPAISGQSSMQ